MLVGCSGGETTVASGSQNPSSDAPTISNVSVSNVTTTSVTVTWTTNENSSTQVQYGTTNAYGATVNGANNTTSHSVNIAGLTAGTTYHYRVVSADAANNSAFSANATFMTQAATTPPASYVLTVIRSGSGTVSSTPAGISCGTTCSASFTANGQVSLFATPDLGHELARWGGACNGNTTCTVSMTQAQEVSANFRQVGVVDLNCGDAWAGSEETTTITAWPYRDCFRTNPVGTRTRITNNVGAEVVWDEGAGWNGQNALRVRPPHILTRDSAGNRINGQGYAGLGEHHFHAVRTKRLNIRYLFRYNSNWAQYAQNTKWEIAIKYDYPNSGPPQRREGCERAMTIGAPGSLGITRKALIVEQGVCTQGWNVPNLNGWYFGPGLRENEWVSVESEFDIDTGLYSTYITTQDGAYNQSLHTQINIAQGEYGAPPEIERDPYWWGSIDCTAGCFWGWPDDGGIVPRPDDTYVWYSHFAMSNTRIGPPAGFVQTSGGVR